MIRRLSDGKSRSVGFGEAACLLDLGVSHEFDTHVVRLVYSAMNTPLTIFDCDMDSGALIPVKSQMVKGAFRADNYITEQVLAISADGTEVPISLMYHRLTPLDGTAPCLLYGYGAYGVSLSASFDSNRLSLVDRGLVYAIVHVRGGGEMGNAWHHAGRAKYKIDGVADFVAAARYLVTKGYCAKSNIVSHGVSAGGALVAAAANMAPEIFSGVIAEAPFVDVLNTMLDATLPLTAQEWQEWGNPAASAAEFDQLARWSPYENVTAQPYPPVLAVIGLLDPRVTYWEAAKWVARLRAYQSGNSPILLRVNFNEGHVGSAGRIKKLVDTAVLYAFVLKVTGRALTASHA
jgi:oligopeptidase B